MCMANFGSCWPSTQPFICLLLYYHQSDDNLHHFVSVGNHLTYSISSQVKFAFDCLLIIVKVGKGFVRFGAVKLASSKTLKIFVPHATLE